MKRFIILITIISYFIVGTGTLNVFAQAQSTNKNEDTVGDYTIFDDKMLLEGYAQKYKDQPLEIILEMIKDDTLTPYRSAAAVRVLKTKYSADLVSRNKTSVIRILLRRLNRTDSPFVQVEIMHTLVLLDRYRYFESMVPALIQKLDHYNSTVNEMAYTALDDIVKVGNNRAREAK